MRSAAISAKLASKRMHMKKNILSEPKEYTSSSPHPDWLQVRSPSRTPLGSQDMGLEKKGGRWGEEVLYRSEET
jgi:hypothetical protein